MTILLFAVLKEYFPSRLHLLDTSITNIQGLKNHLVQLNGNSEKVLNSCRFAVNNVFIDETFKLGPQHTVAIIPPSSGG